MSRTKSPTKPTTPEPYLRAPDAAKTIGVSVQTIRQWTAARKVPHHKIGRLVYYRADELEAWMAEDCFVSPAAQEVKPVTPDSNLNKREDNLG